MSKWLLLVVSLLTTRSESADVCKNRQDLEKPPHIVVILADDLGWNDVGFHGSNQIPTPNIDALAYNGVILNSYYSQPLCSPSRAALLTGKYPIHTGMQHFVILEPEPWGLPLNETLLPERLSALGYSTHAVGKWHLGFFKKEYTPTYRGFDSHFGFWNGYQDYYDHSVQASFTPFEGYDMRRGLDVDLSSRGKYSTHVFTEEAERVIQAHDLDRGPLFLYLAHLAPHAANYEAPLQAPSVTLDSFRHIRDPERRLYAAMVSELDRSVGRVVSALDRKGMLRDSVIVFASDNGAITTGLHSNRGSNWPLKGVKGTPWEGAIRTVACVWSSKFQRPRRVSSQLMHVTDWVPTIYSLAGGSVRDLGAIDGVDMWSALSSGGPSPRSEMLVNVDDKSGYAAVRVGHLKYVNGTTFLGYQDTWDGDDGRGDGELSYDVDQVLQSATSKALRTNLTADALLLLRTRATVSCGRVKARTCDPLQAPCLFDVHKDPCELRNLYETGAGGFFEKIIQRFRGTALPPGNRPTDSRADPRHWNNTWTHWRDYPEPSD